jgi:hypothetical protein
MPRTFGSSLPNEFAGQVHQLHETQSQLRFSKSCLGDFGVSAEFLRVKKLLALLLALGGL